MAPRETENNAYANFWGDKQRALWYLLEWSTVAVTPVQKADNHEQYKDYCNLHSSKSPL